jgi:hypothetical protein
LITIFVFGEECKHWRSWCSILKPPIILASLNIMYLAWMKHFLIIMNKELCFKENQAKFDHDNWRLSHDWFMMDWCTQRTPICTGKKWLFLSDYVYICKCFLLVSLMGAPQDLSASGPEKCKYSPGIIERGHKYFFKLSFQLTIQNHALHVTLCSLYSNLT